MSVLHVTNVKKVTHITLDQGKNHVHRVRYTPNRVMSQEVQMQGEYSMAKFTCYTIVAHGLPSNDITSKAAVSTLMGAVKLDIITKCQYPYTYVAGTMTPITYTNHLAALPNGQDIVNVGSGAIGTDMEA